MYAYIKGKIEEVSEGSLIIECGGIGYEVFVSNQTAAELSSAKGEVKLYTFYKVAEDDVALYGFARKEEKEMFRKLIAVSGVGPKAALAILSGISLKDLALSIATRDAARLTRIKGVGKKTAERIILELKEKVQELFLNDVKKGLLVTCMSFGFKHGYPSEADLTFDVRCLPNPFYIESLKHQTGLDQGVHDYVMQFDQSKELLQKLTDLIDFLMPLYVKEGKSQLVIAFGCTGGKHRSVTFAEEMYRHLQQQGLLVSVNHRDIMK